MTDGYRELLRDETDAFGAKEHCEEMADNTAAARTAGEAGDLHVSATYELAAAVNRVALAILSLHQK